MRFPLCATLSALMLLAPLAPAEASTSIEVNKPKPKRKPKPQPKKEEPKAEPAKPTAKTYEMRLQMSDNQVARDHSSAIFKRLEEYGYQMASDIVFGQIPKAKSDDEEKPADIFENTIFFEVVQSDDACFIISKVMDKDLAKKVWGWETEDDGKLPCDVQMKIAIKDYAWKNPPLKQAEDFVAIEADIDEAVKKMEVDRKNREAARKAAEAAEAEAAAKRAAAAEARRKMQESAAAAPVQLADYGQPDKGMGCSAAASSAACLPGALALALGALRRRRR